MKLKQKYKIAKESKVGDEVTCPSCGTIFLKTNYQQAFCKSKGKTVCKDKYWNTVTPHKRNNTTRISPANAAYMAARKELAEHFDDFDGTWDAHSCYVERCEFCEKLNCECEEF